MLAILFDALMSSLYAEGQSNKVAQILPELWVPESVFYDCDAKKPEPIYQDLPIGQWIQSKTRLNTNRLALSEWLALKCPPPVDGNGFASFELPVNFDLLKNESHGALDLGVINRDGEYVEFTLTGLERAADGNCRIWWNVNFDRPGKHNLRPRLMLNDHWNSITILGPPLKYCSSNACWFSESGSMFDASGAYLDAETAMPVAAYRIEIQDSKGKHLKTITGTTTNGIINADWDLTTERGRKFKGDSFEGSFYIKFPNDGSANLPAKRKYWRMGG